MQIELSFRMFDPGFCFHQLSKQTVVHLYHWMTIQQEKMANCWYVQQLERRMAKFDSNPGSERQAIRVFLHIESLNLNFLDVCINEEYIQRPGI